MPSRSGATIEMPAELRDRVDVGLLRRARQIADRHVLDHAPAKRAHRSHLEAPVLRGMGVTIHILSDRRPSDQQLSASGRAATPAQRVRCVLGMLSSLEVKVLRST